MLWPIVAPSSGGQARFDSVQEQLETTLEAGLVEEQLADPLDARLDVVAEELADVWELAAVEFALEELEHLGREAAPVLLHLLRLPAGLRQFAEYNPVSAWAAGVRTLFGNPTATPADAAWPLQHPVLCSVLWCAGLIAVIAPLTLTAYRRRTSG